MSTMPITSLFFIGINIWISVTILFPDFLYYSWKRIVLIHSFVSLGAKGFESRLWIRRRVKLCIICGLFVVWHTNTWNTIGKCTCSSRNTTLHGKIICKQLFVLIWIFHNLAIIWTISIVIDFIRYFLYAKIWN